MSFLNLKQAMVFVYLAMALGGSASPPAEGQHTSLTKRAVLCQNTSGTLISEINSATCVRLLQISGGTCSVSGTDVVMFKQVGDAAVYGINAAGTGTVSSSCDDVATAAQSIINACNNPNTGLLEGRAQVSGNPNLVVMIDSSHSSVPPCNPCF